MGGPEALRGFDSRMFEQTQCDQLGQLAEARKHMQCLLSPHPGLTVRTGPDQFTWLTQTQN